jgi:hypothetical protein
MGSKNKKQKQKTHVSILPINKIGDRGKRNTGGDANVHTAFVERRSDASGLDKQNKHGAELVESKKKKKKKKGSPSAPDPSLWT